MLSTTTADALEALVDSGRHRRGHDPEGARLRPRGAARRRGRSHPRRPDRARAVARTLHRVRRRHDGGGVVTHLMPTYRDRPSGSSPGTVAGSSTTRAGRTSTSSRASGSPRSATPTRSSAAAVAGPGGPAAPRLEHLRQRVQRGGGGPARLAGRRREPARRPGVLRQLGRRGERVRDQARPALGRTGALRRRVGASAPSTAARSRRCTRRDSPPSTRRSCRCRRDSATSPTATRGAAGDRSRAASPPCCSSRSSASPASCRRPGATSPACGRSATSSGLLLIVDEIQTGLGRTGRWFAFQHEGIVPDIVTIAKALGNGVPVGACWARAEVAKAFRPGDHGSTFGGQPLAMAAAQATLRATARDRRTRRRRGARRAARDAARRVDGVAAVRGSGFLLGRRARGRHRLAGRLLRGARRPGSSSTRRCPGSSGSCRRSSSPPRTATRRWVCSPTRSPGVRAGGRTGKKDDVVTHNLLVVSDLAPTEITTVLDLVRAAEPSARPRGPRRGARLRVPVGADPQRRRDGRRRPRRAPGHDPGRGDRLRRARVGRGRGAHPRLLPRARSPPVSPSTARSTAWRAALADSDPQVPVVNLLSDFEHPTEALGDVLTIRQCLGSLEGKHVAYIGDANNVCRSLVAACAAVGTAVVVASPPGYQLRRRLRRGDEGGRGSSSRSPTTPPGRSGAPTSSTPTCGCRWRTQTRRRRSGPPSAASRSTRRSSPRRPPGRSSSTACPPIAARRSRPRCSRDRTAGSGYRRRTGVT